MCCYVGALGKMMEGSGCEEVILQAGICASGSIAQDMDGKHFNRAMRVHTLMLDAVQRLLLSAFMRETGRNVEADTRFKCLAESPDYHKFLDVYASESDQQFVDEYKTVVESVRKGAIGKTAQFWVQYCDAVWVLLLFQKAIKQNDVIVYVQCLRSLCSLVFSANRLNYARYLPLYHAIMNDIVLTNPAAYALLQQNGLSVARSQVQSCRNAIDLTIEQTINRSAKTSGGIVAFHRNIYAYRRWCLTTHKRATYVESTLEEVGIKSDVSDVHASTCPIG
jgi:hypothetical protein